MEKQSKTMKLICAGAAALGVAGVTAYALKKEKKKALTTDGTGKTVLITGASGGIGKEFAYIFAQHHFNVIAVARNMEKLEELKLELENSYNVKVTLIQKDLSDENAAKEIFDEVQELGIEVSQLVNNAGAGKASRVIDADPDTMKNLIHLNITNLTLLCRYFGRQMAENGYGKILNVSSMGAFIPDPYFNVYGPTKAYELFLTEAMYGELKNTNVTVSALCPGPTRTNWAANAGKSDSRVAKNPAEVAEAGFIGMQEGKLIIIPDADYRTFRRLMQLFPVKFQSNVIAGWQKKLIEK